jgi:hypothetical protein
MVVHAYNSSTWEAEAGGLGVGVETVLRREERARGQWLTPVIPATQEAEIRRIVVQSLPGQIVLEIPSRKIPSQKKKKTGGVA